MLKKIALLVSVFTLSFAVSYFVLAWTEPTTGPPGDNVDSPINVGGTAQSKVASISATQFIDADNPAYWIKPSGVGGVSAVFAENVGIGTDSPLASLDIRGTIENGLIAWWPFDEGTGVSTADHSINNNTGTLYPTGSEPAWLTGKFAQALDFDGVDDYVEVTRGAFDSLSEGTISGWFSRETYGIGDGLWGSQDGGSGNYGYLFWIRIGADDKFEIRLREEWHSENHLLAYSSNTITDSDWHHFAFTVDSSGNKFFVDGIQETMNYTNGSAATSDFYDDIGGDPLYNGIGQVMYRGSWGTFFNGKIDDVRVYNRALSTREVAELYRQKSPSLAQGGTVSGELFATGDICTDAGGGVCLSAGGDDSFWLENGSDIYYNNGNVGIGTPSPDYELDLNGDLRVAGGYIYGPPANVALKFSVTDDLSFYLDSDGSNVGGFSIFDEASRKLFAVGENDGSGDPGGRVVLYDNVVMGIGTEYPASGYKLDVEGQIQATGFDTGDITFRDQSTNQILWRMFEDEEGLYLENVRTGKVFQFVLEEVE